MDEKVADTLFEPVTFLLSVKRFTADKRLRTEDNQDV